MWKTKALGFTCRPNNTECVSHGLTFCHTNTSKHFKLDEKHTKPQFERRQCNPNHTLFCRLVYDQDKSLSQPAGYFFPVRGLYKSFQWFAEWGKIHLSASHFPLACHMTPGRVTKQVLKLWKKSSCQTSLASAAGLIAFKQVAVLNCALWSVHLTRYILTALHKADRKRPKEGCCCNSARFNMTPVA